MNEFTLEDAQGIVTQIIKQNPRFDEQTVIRACLQILAQHYNYSVLTDCGKYRIVGIDRNGMTVLEPWGGV